uniref:Uncharacterized protein n=1 Tax=Daphnia galeata TaxID=27404 RepID=A0A8J2WIE3_9CRUS|nr:unnamed protein product [Daphnia galeata]
MLSIQKPYQRRPCMVSSIPILVNGPMVYSPIFCVKSLITFEEKSTSSIGSSFMVMSILNWSKISIPSWMTISY